MPVYALEKVGVCVLSVEVYQVTLSIPPSPLASIGTVGVRGIVVIIVGTELCVVMIVETVSCVSDRTTTTRYNATRNKRPMDHIAQPNNKSCVSIRSLLFFLLHVNSKGLKFPY